MLYVLVSINLNDSLIAFKTFITKDASKQNDGVDTAN